MQYYVHRYKLIQFPGKANPGPCIQLAIAYTYVASHLATHVEIIM